MTRRARVLPTAVLLVAAVVLSVPAGVRPAAGEAPQVLDEVTVTGERPGPGMWHVTSGQGRGQVWILGSMSPLPQGITWRSRQLEQVLEGATRVVVPKPFEVGIVRVLWLLITERDLLMVGGGRRLKDVMPPAMHVRFAALRAKYTTDADKWERYRPIIAAAFLQQAAFHSVHLSTRLDLGAAVRALAKKHDVRVEEIKLAGMHDVLDALKTMPAATENACVEASLATVERDLPRLVERADAWANGDLERIQRLGQPAEVDACRVALEEGRGPSELIAEMRGTYMENIDKYLRSEGTTVIVVNMDLLLEKDGLLDQLRAKGYQIVGP